MAKSQSTISGRMQGGTATGDIKNSGNLVLDIFNPKTNTGKIGFFVAIICGFLFTYYTKDITYTGISNELINFNIVQNKQAADII